jgi:hypothetical protein
MNTARIKPSARDRIAGYIAVIPVTALMLHCKLTILELEKALEALHCSIGRPVTCTCIQACYLLAAADVGKTPPSPCRQPFAGISHLRRLAAGKVRLF